MTAWATCSGRVRGDGWPVRTVTVTCPRCEEPVRLTGTYIPGCRATWDSPAERAEWDPEVPAACPHCHAQWDWEEIDALAQYAQERVMEGSR